MIDSQHNIVLANGHFSTTSRAELTSAFDAFVHSSQKERLVIHFHGGLVDEHAATDYAAYLRPFYQEVDSYPLFVIWKSALLEILRNNWKEIVEEDIFPLLLDRVLQFVVGKLDQSDGERGGTVELPTRFAIQNEVKQKRAVLEEPYAERDPEVMEMDAQLSPEQLQQFEDLLRSDGELNSAAAQLNRTAGPLLNPTLKDELDQALALQDAGERSIVSTALLVGAGVRILIRVLNRFSVGSDHGIYTTVVEEVVRELKGDLLGSIVWKHIKEETLDSFSEPSTIYGGTALLSEISRIWQNGHRPRLVLVGHSAGAIYICNLLEKAQTFLPQDIRFEVIFLAPACTFKLLDLTLATAGNRITSFRSFGLADELEKRDATFKPIYLRSLLYLVSGLVEEAVDIPLVGMQRYHVPPPTFDKSAYPEIKRVLDYIAKFPKPWVWENSGLLGLSTNASNHGGFGSEPVTLASVTHLVAQGVNR